MARHRSADDRLHQCGKPERGAPTIVWPGDRPVAGVDRHRQRPPGV